MAEKNLSALFAGLLHEKFNLDFSPVVIVAFLGSTNKTADATTISLMLIITSVEPFA